MSRKFGIISAVVLVLLLGAAYFFYFKNTPWRAAEKIDPSWKTFSNPNQGVDFRYPEKIPAKYVYAVDWPPQVIVMNVPFSCAEAGEETARAGKTEKKTIGGKTYCVTTETGGAAGSIYSQYAYIFKSGNRLIDFVFSLRRVQCGNYDEPDKTECEKDQASFDIDRLVDKIAGTVK